MIANSGHLSEAERQFHDAMIDTYKIAKRDCDYNATYFLGMVIDYGGLNAAKRLLATTEPSDGFTTLWMCGRLDLTVEAHVLKPEFQSLFTPEEIAIARSQLKEYGYPTNA